MAQPVSGFDVVDIRVNEGVDGLICPRATAPIGPKIGHTVRMSMWGPPRRPGKQDGHGNGADVVMAIAILFEQSLKDGVQHPPGALP